MYTLGVNGRAVTHDKRHRGHGGNHNSSACLLKDGELLSFVEEERFVHMKQYGGFPVHSIKYCLEHAGITLDDVDHVAVGWSSFRSIFFQRIFHFIKTGLFFRVPTFCAGISFFPLQDWINGDVIGAFKKHFGRVDKKKFHFIPHHIAHAASSFRASGFENAAVINFDGAGETTTTWLGIGRDNDLTVKKEIKLPHSFGFYYAGFTEYLGFIKNNDEYKVMGLACYGEPNKKIDDVLKVKKDGYKVNVGFLYHFNIFKKRYSYRKMIRRYGPSRLNDDQPITQRHKDIAASVQAQLENAGVTLTDNFLKHTKDKNLCLAGGVALNCKMNKKIREVTKVKEVFVQPAAADMGVALGAALELYAQLGHKSKFKMEHVYYGPEYSDKEVEAALKKSKLKYRRVRNIHKIVAKHIHNNKVVGWFQGRLEAGPRALGNRSILANPCTPGMDDIVNEKIKFREKWRPFCPSLIEEAKDRYFVNAYESPFMIMTFNVKKGVEKQLPSVVHVDGTVRPQTVKRHVNPKYYSVIEEFGKLSGHPIIMNTSFNIKGDTIVNTPDDAIRTFLKTDMDVLAAGDFIVEK